MNDPGVLPQIRDLLAAHGASFREVHHEPTRTSEDSARARGEDLRTGGKALLMKGDGEYRLFVLPADRKVDSSAIRRELGLRKLRFATPAELAELTGLVPGSVPPFGRPVLPFELFVDSGIPGNERIAFNAGSLTDSIILATADYLRVARPVRIFPFAS
ncbi:MAG TPA: YbaK/EbsC family protein [Planctomycetaceae bacterium]|nr:YbaK/EbsC family protein [Planctomycetaceae bacterium]